MFVEGPRKIFAHLLTFHPTPEELVWWMSHPEEIDRRVKGTEYAAMIDLGSPPQRNGVLGSLNMVADALKTLPREKETSARWSTLEWSKRRKGWLFFTSTPETRKRLAPLISLWLDTLVLRLMNQASNGGQVSARPVWFFLDELASLQRLPQLHTAITENRKSNNPMVLGFQGRSQLETRYGHEAEAMLSQPATKIFLRTSEARAAKWISDTIGEQEIERIRESRSSGQYPQSRRSKSYNPERQVEPLVMASEISGLANLHGYLKSGNLVVRLSFPYIELPNRQPAYIERAAKIEPPQLREESAAPVSRNGAREQKIEPQPQEVKQTQQQVVRAAAARVLKREDPLKEPYIRLLHKRMFGDTWRWAGTYRKRETNIGIQFTQITERIGQLLGNARYWLENKTFPIDEIAVRFHHQLVFIHPFPNGNGRHTRMMADVIAVRSGRDAFTWGRTNLQDAGGARTTYIAALQEADLNQDRIGKLLEFARS